MSTFIEILKENRQDIIDYLEDVCFQSGQIKKSMVWMMQNEGSFNDCLSIEAEGKFKVYNALCALADIACRATICRDTMVKQNRDFHNWNQAQLDRQKRTHL